MQLSQLKMGATEPLTKYVSRAKEIQAQLRAAGQDVADTEIAWSVMSGLPSAYATMATVITATTDGDLSLDDILPKLLTVCWTAGHLAAPAPASCPACSPTAPTALGRGQTESQMAKPKATRPTPAPAGKTQRSAPPTQCHLSAPSSWRRHLAATRHLAILPCMHIIPCISPCLSFSPSALPQ